LNALPVFQSNFLKIFVALLLSFATFTRSQMALAGPALRDKAGFAAGTQ
jgi:hypothetical protein